jgi:hypothetical protein
MTLYYQFFRFLILPGKFQDRIARLDKFRDKSEQPAPFFFLEDSPKDRTYNDSGSRISERATFRATGFVKPAQQMTWYRLFFVSV